MYSNNTRTDPENKAELPLRQNFFSPLKKKKKRKKKTPNKNLKQHKKT